MSALDEAKNPKRKSRKRKWAYGESVSELQRALKELRTKLIEPNNDTGKIAEDKQRRKVTAQLANELRGQLMQMLERNPNSDFGVLAKAFADKHNVDEEELFQAVSALMSMNESKIIASLKKTLTEAKAKALTSAVVKQCHAIYMDALDENEDADLESIVQDFAQAVGVDADDLHDAVSKLMKKHESKTEAKDGPSAALKFFYASKFMGQTGPFLRVTGTAGKGEQEIMAVAEKVVPALKKGDAKVDAKEFNAAIDKIEEALKKMAFVKVTKGKTSYAPEFNELDVHWVGESKEHRSGSSLRNQFRHSEETKTSHTNELIEQLYEMKKRLSGNRLDEGSLSIQFDAFTGEKLKSGRNVIKGFEVDLHRAERFYVLTLVNKAETERLRKLLRKSYFTVQADHKRGQIVIISDGLAAEVDPEKGDREYADGGGSAAARKKELRKFGYAVEERLSGNRLDESLIDKLEKFAGENLKPGRNVINGYPVDIEDSDGSYIVMKPVDKDAVTGLVKELRKAGFKAKADKTGEITIVE